MTDEIARLGETFTRDSIYYETNMSFRPIIEQGNLSAWAVAWNSLNIYTDQLEAELANAHGVAQACEQRAEKSEHKTTELLTALQNIVDCYAARSDLYMNDADCAEVLYDKANFAIKAAHQEELKEGK